ncbi:MAG: hypothetical protein JEZ10_09545 [Verrucomicrobia bacterium]|nr:hypothetical protein [Verrucomicrobiota bacterium]
MDKWLDALKEIGLAVFGRESTSEMWAVVVVCIFAVFMVYEKIAVGFPGKGSRSFLTLIPGIVLLALASVAAQLYLTNSWIIQTGAILAVLLVVVLPLTKAVEKTSYLNALLIWTACAVVMGVILYMEPLVVQSFRRGIEKGSLMKNQHEIGDDIMRQVDK